MGFISVILTEPTTPSNKKGNTYWNRKLAEMWNYVLVLFILMKLKAFSVTQNEIP